jgi:hypothetical protein
MKQKLTGMCLAAIVAVSGLVVAATGAVAQT